MLKIAFYANKAVKFRDLAFDREKDVYIEDEHEKTKILSNILYDIKHKCAGTAIKILMSGRIPEYKDWGFEKQSTKGNVIYLFQFLAPDEMNPYSFHTPEKDMKDIFSERELEVIDSGQYDISENLKRYFIGNINKKHVVNKLKLTNIEKQLITDALRDCKTEEDRLKKIEDFLKNTNLSEEDRLTMTFFIIRNNLVQSNGNIDFIKLDDLSSDAEKNRDRLLEKLFQTNKIAVQHGENLDINACIATIKAIIPDIEIIRVSAGNEVENAVNIDTGKLKGIKIEDEEVVINADEKMKENSAVAVLAMLGFKVPSKIIEYADKVITDAKCLLPNYGLYLARKLPTDRLFEFAEEIREDGSYLIDTSLNDDEIKKYELQTEVESKREKIENGLKMIASNSYITEDGKRLTIVPEIIDCGSFLAYAVGYDYYSSVTEKQEGLSTFSILANPKTNVLPINIKEYVRSLDIVEKNSNETRRIDEYKYKDFIYEDKVIVGGFKNKTLFARYKQNELIEKIKEMFNARKILIDKDNTSDILSPEQR